MSDPLDGYRDSSLIGARVLEKQSPDSALWQRLYLGDAAKKLMQGIADRNDITKVMSTVVSQCELDVKMNCQRMLESTDPGSVEAREAHFKARVASEIIGRINHLVRDGMNAADEINTKGEK